MSTTVTATPLYLLIAMCGMEEPVCPGCGQQLMGRSTTRPDGATLTTCMNRKPAAERRGPTDHSCGTHVAVLPIAGSPLSMVLRLDDHLFRRITADHRPLHEHFREANLVVRKVARRPA